MNKKVNAILFVLGATLFNILVTVVSFILLLVICSKFIIPHLPEAAQAQAAGWSVVLIFIAAIAISFVAYRLALKLLLNKVQIDKYLDPLFSGRRKPPN